MSGSVQARLKQRRFRNSAEAAFVGLLVAAEHVNQRLDDVCSQHGLTHTQYNVLRILRGAHPGGHPRFEIANRLISRAPDVTRLLDRLDRQGLIERTWSPENRRHSIARITAKGMKVLQSLDPEVLRLQDQALEPLTREEIDRLAAAVDKLVP